MKQSTSSVVSINTSGLPQQSAVLLGTAEVIVENEMGIRTNVRALIDPGAEV